MDLRYTLGLDLGQAKDFTAVAIGEWVRDKPPYTVDVRHLQRFRSERRTRQSWVGWRTC